MPFPNEHAARVRSPGDFTKGSFRRIKLKGVAGISLIIGRLKGKTTTTTQAYRFAISKFTADEARKWLRDHKIKTILFEPATGKKASAEAVAADTEELTAYEQYINTLLTGKTPAVAGENISGDAEDINQEVISMTLKEIMASDPAVKLEVEALLATERTAGLEEGRAEVQTRIDAIVPFIGNKSYPGIDALAKEVLSGKADVAALKGAVTAYDMLKETDNSDAAETESAAAGETPAEGDNAAVDDVAAMVAADSKKIGRVE